MTKNLTYLIKLTYDKAFKGYVADVANLYGCMSQGKTKEEAIKNVKKAIKAYMEALGKTENETKNQVINVPITFSTDLTRPFSYA